VSTSGYHLVELGQGVFAFVDPDPRFGRSNVGLVIDEDGLTVIDTTATPLRAAQVGEAIRELTAHLALPVKRVVLTSSRIAFSGGGQQFWSAAFYGSESTSSQLDVPVNPAALRALLPEYASAFHDEFTTRPVTHIISQPIQLTPALAVTPLTGESAGNLAVTVESVNVIFAGALASFGVTPLAYDAFPESWIDRLHRWSEAGVTVVPGHGPPGGAADLRDLAEYLVACRQAKTPSDLGDGPWRHWTDRRFDQVNIDRAFLRSEGRDEVPSSMFELLGL